MKRRGIMFIELLVVIAIIAMLAAILFPVFARAREKSRLAHCKGNLKALGKAFWAYTADYDGQTPPPEAPTIGYLWSYLPLRLVPEDGGPYECAETALSAPVVEAAGNKVSICYLFNRDFLGKKREEVLRGASKKPLAAEGIRPDGVFASLADLKFPHSDSDMKGAVLYTDGRALARTRAALEVGLSQRDRTAPLPPGVYSTEELAQMGAMTVVGEDGKMEVRVALPPGSKAEVELPAERGAK